MKPIRRIVWVLPHPTPFNTYLLNSLQERIGVPSEAVYRFGVLKTHPWTKLPERHFPNRQIAASGGRDRDLESMCATDDSTLVIFSGWRDSTMFPAMRRRWSNRLPYAFWSDTPKIGNGIPRRALNSVQVFFTRRAVALLATGAPGIENYTKMGVEPRKLRNFPVVVDPTHFGRAVSLRQERTDSNSVSFVLPARLSDKLKGQRVAIEALATAARELPAFRLRLVLAGVGEDEAELRRFAAENGVGDFVEFRGWVEYEFAPAMYAEADALVIPSWWDPYPVVVIEAMAAGLPVLGSSACGTVRERVVQGKNGFMHTTGNARELADHMITVAKSPVLRAEMGAHALQTSHNWGIEISVNTMRTLLSELAAA